MRAIRIINIAAILLAGVAANYSQGFTREIASSEGAQIEIINLNGRVEVSANGSEAASATSPADFVSEPKIALAAFASPEPADSEIRIQRTSGRTRVEIKPSVAGRRIDVQLIVPRGARLAIETADGEVRLAGAIGSANVMTETGTIATDVPTDDLRYTLTWTASKPRYVGDFELEKVQEKSAGKFQIKGRFSDPADGSEPVSEESPPEKKKNSKRREKSSPLTLNLTTARGIILINVPPNEVSNDLRERPLTNAAKAIIRSGDTVLTDAIRRASPRLFGDYARTLPPPRRVPILSDAPEAAPATPGSYKRVGVRVTDSFNRSIAGLGVSDFSVSENGVDGEVAAVGRLTTPINLVLLLDVSGSVDNYVNFIRKAARSFIDTVDPKDRVSIVLFNDDVNVLARFTTDKSTLSESLNTFDAGGATAYYDALAYTLADTLRPLRGERTAVVVLTDGDDNRSFLPFESLIRSIEESGAIIYPLYVPSSLIASSNGIIAEQTADPLRTRYLTLTSRAEAEGARLAKISGGIFYPITQLGQIQTAYQDIVRQLRTAYVLTYRSGLDGAAAPKIVRLKVRVKRDDAFAKAGVPVGVSAVGPAEQQ